MSCFEEECSKLRKLLRLTADPGSPSEEKDAGVLILLDREKDDYRVLLCVRSEELRRHPGEVCFPGGMRDESDADLQNTAMREAQEEVGIGSEDYMLLGSLPRFRSRFGVMIHPSVALLRRPFDFRLNPDEVSRCFWKPLKCFLSDEEHGSFPIDSRYSVHTFYFDESPTYGVTALMCIVVGMGVLQKQPLFDISPQITLNVMKRMTVDQAIDTVFFNAAFPFKPLSRI